MLNVSEKWDVIFVGTGISALVCAASLRLRDKNLKILMLDKHIVPGGYASAFERKKVDSNFECSLHKMSGMNDGGNLRNIYNKIGLDDELELVFPPDYFELAVGLDRHTFSSSPDEMEQSLYSLFPQEITGIKTFFEDVRTHGKDGYYQFQMMTGDYEPDDFKRLRYGHKELKKVTVDHIFEQMFEDSLLKEILAAPGIYVGGLPEDMSYLYYLHVVYATLNKGSAYVKGGAQKMSNLLVEKITETDSEVVLGTLVSKVLVEGDNTYGVETKKGKKYFSDNVVINAAPHYALDSLFSPSSRLDVTKEKIKSLKPANSTGTVYLVLDQAPESLGLTSTETMISSCPYESMVASRKAAKEGGYQARDCELAYWQLSTMEITNYHRLDAASGQVVCLNVLDVIQHWPRHKSQEYREKKDRLGKVLLERLCECFPKIRGHVIHTEISTPRTYVKFTNNTDGSGYGAMIGTDQTGYSFSRSFPYAGTEFLSAWVAGPSYEAAFGYADFKANAIKLR